MAMVNLTNYRDHPTNPTYMVFFFHNKNAADSFEELLLINVVDFERAREDEGRERHLFGVKKTEFHKAEKLNYEAIGRHRQKFIGNRFLRIAVLFFTLVVLLLAIIGAYKASF